MAAGPTTVTTLTEMVNAEWINPVILEYAHDFTVAAPFLLWKDLRGKGTKVGSFPRWVLDTASTALDETTDLTTEDLETLDVQITAAEIGIRRDVTDIALEDTLVGSALFDFIVKDAGLLFAINLDNDICALFPSLATSVGTSGSDLTLANMVEAQANVRINGQRGSLVYILDDQQALDYQAAQAAATSTTINGMMEPSFAIDNGYLGTFFGHQVWQTGLCDAANTNANKVGACFVRGDTNPNNACFAGVISREITTEMHRNAPGRETQVVATMRYGVGEVLDLSGVKIVTDL